MRTKRGKEARRYERHRGTDTERFAFYHMFVAAFDCDCVQGVWWIYSNILERQLNINKGIPLTGYTPEEVSIIVRKNLVCPLVEEIGEDEQGSMFFQCKSERYFSRMESGRFYIIQKKRPWINPDFLSEEGWELQFCIGDIFSGNPEQDRETFTKRKRIMQRGT